jgi:hypothetical protein
LLNTSALRATGEVYVNAITTAHLIKVWLREMPQRLLSSVPKGVLLSSGTEAEILAMVEKYIPANYQDLIWWLCDLLIEVALREKTNRMNPVSLSVCVGPNLFEADDSPNASPMEAIMLSQRAVNVLYRLLIHRQRDWDVYNNSEYSELDNVIRPDARMTSESPTAGSFQLELPTVVEAAPSRAPTFASTSVKIQEVAETGPAVAGAEEGSRKTYSGNRNQRLGGWMLKELAALLPGESVPAATANGAHLLPPLVVPDVLPEADGCETTLPASVIISNSPDILGDVESSEEAALLAEAWTSETLEASGIGASDAFHDDDDVHGYEDEYFDELDELDEEEEGDDQEEKAGSETSHPDAGDDASPVEDEGLLTPPSSPLAREETASPNTEGKDDERGY